MVWREGETGMKGKPSSKNIFRWFDPRGRSVSSWGFIINRVTALGLSLYLILHLIMLGQLMQGQKAYDSFIALVKNPVFTGGELLVIAAGILHGINGIRIGLTSFGIAVRYQKIMLLVGAFISAAGILFFGIRMLGGA
jgi:succinate dehydrogenase / fumarate reductase, cytochrome b subunit